MRKIILFFIILLFGFNNMFANSDVCYIQDKDFLKYNTDFLSKSDKTEILKISNNIAEKLKNNSNRNTLLKNEIENIISEIELAESGNSFYRGSNWEYTKSKKYFLIKSIYSEFLKVCNKKVESNANTNVVEHNTYIQEFKIKEFKNEYNNVSIKYSYNGNKRIYLMYQVYLNKKYNKTYVVPKNNIVNFKKNIIPNKKYYYYFIGYDYKAKSKKILKRGSFISKRNNNLIGVSCPLYSIVEPPIGSKCKLIFKKDSNGCSIPKVTCPTPEVKCGSLNGKTLSKLPSRLDKNLCEDGNVFSLSKDYPGYYWSCIGKDQKKVYCNAKMSKICTQEYKPVCAEKIEQCSGIFCPKIKNTYSNKCMAEVQGAKFLYEGKCIEKKEFIRPKKDGMELYDNFVTATQFCKEQGYKNASYKRGLYNRFSEYVRSYYKGRWIITKYPFIIYSLECKK